MNENLNPSIFERISAAVVNGEEDNALELTRQALAQGIEPLEVVDKGFIPGLQTVGEEYESGLCFVPELVIAGRIMRRAMELLGRAMREKAVVRPSLGKVVIGTVSGDVHTIGKDLVATLLNLNGFQVIDLGFNVPSWGFVEEVQKNGAQILGLSSLLTTTMHVQKQVIQKLSEAGIRQRVKVIIGGGATSAQWAQEIGADAYGENAQQAVRLCMQLIAQLDSSGGGEYNLGR